MLQFTKTINKNDNLQALLLKKSLKPFQKIKIYWIGHDSNFLFIFLIFFKYKL